MKKAKIKDFDKYIAHVKENPKAFCNAFYDKLQGDADDDSKRLWTACKSLVDTWGCNGTYVSDSLCKKANYINRYIEENGFYWEIPVQKHGYAIVHYGTIELLILDLYLEYKEETDFSHITISSLNAKVSDPVSMLPTELNEKSLAEVQNDSDTVDAKIEQLRQDRIDIKEAKTGELKEMQEQIDNLLAEMNKKKEIMLQELNQKMAAFERQKKELEAQIYMLQTEIYSIRCFMGETVELIGVRSGKAAPVNEPVVLNQKILYLDEDLGRMMSIYQTDLENYKLLEEALKFNDAVFESFCPQNKCITFFRVSKSAEITSFNTNLCCLDSYAMLHGKKIGFAVRNGEQLYLGWLEEEWEKERELTFAENVILRAGKKDVTAGDEAVSTPLKERVSRMFAINVLRGLLSNGKIMELPAGEDLLKPSKYVIHNYADAWLDDNRYGDFATLVKNLHYYDREKDKILLITSASESWNSHKNGPLRGLEDAQVNRTHDCSVNSGLNTINMIDKSGNIYVSAVKEYSIYGARSNFLIEKGEFLNLTFMNSLWLEYYIMTKKIGDFGRKLDQYGRYTTLDYAYLIPFFKQALEYLRNREKEEADYLKPYVNLEDYDEWQILLSHWKIAKKVHHMTDYQAKRFAKYLLQGTYFEMAHLFDAAYQSDKPDLHGSYSTTDIYEFGNHYYIRWMESTGENHPFYGYGGEYEKAKFNNESTADDIKKRADMDKCKLKAIKSEVDIWLKEKNIALTDIRPAIKQIIQKQKEDDEAYRGWKENPVDIYKKETIIGMFVLSFLEPGNYRITDYDNLKKEHLEKFLLYMEKEGRGVSKKLYPLCYYRMLQYECFDRILNVADEILEERWYFETMERK